MQNRCWKTTDDGRTMAGQTGNQKNLMLSTSYCWQK